MKLNKFIKLKKAHKSYQGGFTLIETLIAILILTLAITGPIYISSLSFRNNIQSRDNISAQYLAEEVIEVIKNKKDQRALVRATTSEWLMDASGEAGVTDDASCFNSDRNNISNKCVMTWSDANQGYEFTECTSGLPCPNMSFDIDSESVIYGKGGMGSMSKFTREFYFQKGVNDTSSTEIPDYEADLVVNVKWREKDFEKTYTLSEKFYPINYNLFFKK